MISIYAFSVFLWICLAVQAPAQGALTKINRVERKPVGNDIQLTVEFEGDLSRDEVHWFKPAGNKHNAYKDFTLEPGKTSLKVPKGSGEVYVWLGNVAQHFVELHWNLKQDSERSDNLNYELSEFSSPDVIIPVQSEKEVTITRLAKAYQPIYGTEGVVGVYSEISSGGRENVPFIKQSTSNENGRKVTKITFNKDTEEGYFFCIMVDQYRDSNLAVIWVEEMMTITAHEQGKTPGFPNSRVEFTKS